MKIIAVVALKGGVGKTSLVAGVGLSLVDQGYKVGFLDIDVTGSNLYSALGLAHSPKWELDSPNKKVVVPEVNGYWLLSIASHAGEEYAVLWEGSHHAELVAIREKIQGIVAHIVHSEGSVSITDLEEINQQISDIVTSSKWHIVTELLSPDIVTWPRPLDYLIVDLPPSTSSEMLSFLEQTKDLFGVLIVSQPAKISTIGLQRTIDLLRNKQIPIIGLVANQDGYLNQHGEIEYQFLSPRVDLKEVAQKSGIPFLISIPQSGDRDRLEPCFRELVDKVIGARPVVLKEVTRLGKLKRQVVKGVARGVVRIGGAHGSG